eukprot:CAMPEP_0202702390 /NCGR_PEP_ID=MMETSP1385-20130828/15379_1 /ASSEMBLY_ACC=CAM_ASM_000861 /TAXON_ID=933848 /ORGANISM="Elphidium margaritaceum" /LENGTH=396 /DNA_ID=CAMNT_0049360031 /DNA_START=223 /DNA_END=1413 /DNA_ORIENTATION=+
MTCFSKSITCPSSSRCNVECSGASACQGVTIDGTQAASLRIVSTGQDALSYAQVYCPTNNSDDDDASYSCSVSHNDDTTDGLNNLNVFTVHGANDVAIDCSSATDGDDDDDDKLCWNDEAPYPPVVHYGDNYAMQCTLTNSMECVSSTQSVVTAVDNNASLLYQQFEVRAAVILFAMGSAFGIMLTLCMCLVCPRQCACSDRCRDFIRQSSRSPTSDIMTPTPRQVAVPTFLQRLQRRGTVNRLSPQLQKLSPSLNPQKTEVDFACEISLDNAAEEVEQPQQFELTLPAAFHKPLKPAAAVHVTVEKYANDDNTCDEEPTDVKTPSSTLAQISPRRFPSYVPYIKQGEPTGTLSVITPVEMDDARAKQNRFHTAAVPIGHNMDKSIDVDLIVLDSE